MFTFLAVKNLETMPLKWGLVFFRIRDVIYNFLGSDLNQQQDNAFGWEHRRVYWRCEICNCIPRALHLINTPCSCKSQENAKFVAFRSNILLPCFSLFWHFDRTNFLPWESPISRLIYCSSPSTLVSSEMGLSFCYKPFFFLLWSRLV